MTVAELTAALAGLPQDLDVKVWSDSGHLDAATRAEVVFVNRHDTDLALPGEAGHDAVLIA